MLDEKAHFGELQRPKEVVVHAAVGQLHNDVGQGAAMFRAVLRFFERGEDREGLRLEALRVVKAEEWLR